MSTLTSNQLKQFEELQQSCLQLAETASGVLQHKNLSLSGSDPTQLYESGKKLLMACDKAIADALRAKDLEVMRQLSAARNALYQPQRRLREVLFPETISAPAAAPSSTSTSAKDSSRVPPTRNKSAAAAVGQKRRPTPKISVLTPTAESKAAAAKNKQRLLIAGIASIVTLLVIVVAVRAFRGNRQPAVVAAPVNLPPKMLSVALTQTPTGIVARMNAQDPEHQRLIYLIRWYVDGQPIASAKTARLAPDAYTAGQTIFVEVAAWDGQLTSQAIRSEPLQGAARAAK